LDNHRLVCGSTGLASVLERSFVSRWIPEGHGGAPHAQARTRARFNLRIQFVDVEDADARIAFQPGRGSWSYIGTLCKNIDAAQPTVNYGWLTAGSPDDEGRRVVLRLPA
jgi:hypothetical protein